MESHTVDMVVETYLTTQWLETIDDWHETTLDATRDWDQVWWTPTDWTNRKYPFGMTWFGKSGAGLRTIADDLSHPTLTNLDYEMWFGLGAELPALYVDEINPHTPSAPLIADFRLFCATDDSIWAVAYWHRNVAQVTKLNANGGLDRIASRNCQVFNGTAVATTWRCHADGDDLHIVWSDSNISGTDYYFAFYYSLWDMGTSSWVVENELIYEKTDVAPITPVQGYGPSTVLTTRSSDGQVLVLHPHATGNNGGESGSTVGFSRRTGLNTWSTTSWLPTYLATGSSEMPIWSQNQMWVMEGADSRVHFIYNLSNTDVRHRSVSSANVLDTESQVVNGASTSGFPYGPTSHTVVVDGSTTHITFPWDTTPYETRIVHFISEANPTFSLTTALGGGTNEEYYKDGDGVSSPRNYGILFKDVTGLRNLYRHQLTFITLRTVPDVVGSWIYYEPGVSAHTFGSVRGHVGAWQGSGIYEQTTDRTEWIYPGVMQEIVTPLGWPDMGHFVRGGVDYVYHYTPSGSTIAQRGTAHVYYVMPVPAIPVIPSETRTHTVDATLSGVSDISNTVDMELSAFGAVTHGVTMRLVDRNISAHSVDQRLFLLQDRTHTVDMYLQGYVDIVVALSRSDTTLGASTAVSTEPPIEGLGVIGGDGSSHSSGSSGGGAGSGRIRYASGKFIRRRNG